MSAWLTMETVNIPVPTLRATLAAPVTLAMNSTAMDSTAQVRNIIAWLFIALHACVSVQMSTSASLVKEDVNMSVRILLGTSAALVHLDTAWTVIWWAAQVSQCQVSSISGCSWFMYQFQMWMSATLTMEAVSIPAVTLMAAFLALVILDISWTTILLIAQVSAINPGVC